MKPVQFIEHEGRARLALPSFKLLHRQPDPPHTAYTILSKIVPNEYGTSVTYKIEVACKGKTWWISASYGTMRASNMLRTTSAGVAQLWIEYVTRGDVCVADPSPPTVLNRDADGDKIAVRILDRGKHGKVGIVTSRGRVYACTWSADTALTETAVSRAFRKSRRDFRPFDESSGVYTDNGGRS